MSVPGWLRRALIRSFITDGISLQDIVDDDAACRHFVEARATGDWHASCTCRMGAPDDPQSVTNECGAVLNTIGLYVADASVMPELPSANTNIPTIMLAEKMSDVLLGRTAP